MNELMLVKKYTNSNDVKYFESNGYKFYFQYVDGEIKEIYDVKYFYSISSYIVVVTKQSFYMAMWHSENTVYCFAECDTLQEACENL